VLERWLAFWLLNGVICVLIERLHRARHRVEASEQLRAVTLNSIGDAVIATDVEGRINFLNPAAERLSGWRAAEALGRDIAECFPLVSMQDGAQIQVSSAIDLNMTRGLTQNTLLRKRNGELLPIDGSVSPIREADGLTQGMVVTLRDRSDSVRAATVAREHAELQHRLATIAKVLPGGLHTLRMDKENKPHLDYISDSFAALMDRTVEEMRQNSPTLLSNVPPEDAAGLAHAVREGVQTLRPYHVEFRLHHSQRGLRWMALDAAPRREGDEVVSYSRPQTYRGAAQGVAVAVACRAGCRRNGHVAGGLANSHSALR
jgi:PAS domain S-box-containing protein